MQMTVPAGTVVTPASPEGDDTGPVKEVAKSRSQSLHI